MNYHKTPQHIVKLIKRHVPKNAVHVLEPAVGEGALLEALSPFQFNEHLTLVDVDLKRLQVLDACYGDLSLVNEDFLEWAKKLKGSKSYDLVVTNPPFSARSEEWVWYDQQKLPIEIAFLRNSVELLGEKGTLIAIVPDSFVNSCRFKSQREWLVSQGSIKYAYQLPRKSFSGIEGAFFLLVFKKGEFFPVIKIRSFGSEGQLEIKVGDSFFKNQGLRLDFNYYAGKIKYDSLVKPYRGLRALALKDFCSVKRGPIRKAYNSPGVLHSNSYQGGYWESYKLERKNDEGLCVAVKRVSRNAHMSFGLFYKKDLPRSTDCIISIDADGVCAMSLLFFLRVMFSNHSGESLLLKGVGAKFITVDSIKEIEYMDISKEFDREFSCYLTAYKAMRFDLVESIESIVFMKINNYGSASSIELKMIEDEVRKISFGGQVDVSVIGG